MSEDIANSLRSLRLAAGITQSKVASLCCKEGKTISRRDVSKYERGDVLPPADKYLTIVRVLSRYISPEE
jgi:transcriptional regulator with XRE-family HTH domain